MNTPTIYLCPDHPVVARLIELQGGMSNQRFADRWLSCTVSSWGRILDGKYHAKDASHMLAKLESDLAALEKAHARDVATASADIVGVSLIRQGMMAVERAYGESRDRLVAVLAPTGGGKTTFARALVAKNQGTIAVEASETWRSSYLAACHGLLSALGHTGLPAGTRAAERLLLDTLHRAPKLIVIDEAHYFGPATINLVKAILNQSASTVVMLSIPELWERMKRRAWEESEQLRSRTCAVVAIDQLSARDVGLLVGARLDTQLRASAVSEGEAGDIVRAIRAEANRFGLLATVTRICAELVSDPEARISAESVLKACGLVAALRR